MAKVNPMFASSMRFSENIKAAKDRAKKSDVIPFGEEKLDSRELRARADHDQEARKAMLHLDEQGNITDAGRKQVLNYLRARQKAE
jgi:hypothetical protein